MNDPLDRTLDTLGFAVGHNEDLLQKYQQAVQSQFRRFEQSLGIDWNAYTEESRRYRHDFVIPWLRKSLEAFVIERKGIDSGSPIPKKDADKDTVSAADWVAKSSIGAPESLLRCELAACVITRCGRASIEALRTGHPRMPSLVLEKEAVELILEPVLGRPLTVQYSKSQSIASLALTQYQGALPLPQKDTIGLAQYRLGSLGEQLNLDVLDKSATNGCPMAMLILLQKCSIDTPRRQIDLLATQCLYPALDMSFVSVQRWICKDAGRDAGRFSPLWTEHLFHWAKQVHVKLKEEKAKCDRLQEIHKCMDEGQIIIRLVSQYVD